jgi:alpha-glucosidase
VPLWNWLRGYFQGAMGLDEVVFSPVPYPTAALAVTWRSRQAAIPWVVAAQQYNLLGSHDTSRIRSQLGENDALHRLAVTVQLTYPGVPGLYYGDEIGMVNQNDLPHTHALGCMIWDQSRWNYDLFHFFQDLIALRRRSPVLQRGGFQMLAVEPDTFTYQRESLDGRVIVVAHRGKTPRPARGLAVAHGGIPDGTRFVEFFSGRQAVVERGLLPIGEHPQGATLWEENP